MVTLIAALSDNRVIGNKGNLPWNIPEDLRRFKELTKNHPVIMGRSTYESILTRIGKPLPDRTNIVVSSTLKEDSRITLCRTFEEARVKAYERDDTIYVIGGERIYASALPQARRMELTHVHLEVQGDAYFPSFDINQWNITSRDNRGEYEFVTYMRKADSR